MGIDSSVLHAGSAWPASEVERFLKESQLPVRLGCLASNGAPLVCSLWYLYDEGAIWCATQRDARIVRWLTAEPRCAFEVAGDTMPYRGVRGQGRAVISTAQGGITLGRLVDRYLHGRSSPFAQWLLGRQADEVALRIEPAWLTSWDFSRRMRD